VVDREVNPMATNRPPFVFLGTGAAAGSPITVAGAQPGDLVIPIANMNAAPAVAITGLEAVVSVAGQVQTASSATGTANVVCIMIYPQGWKSIQN
jgi:hypothetical protein